MILKKTLKSFEALCSAWKGLCVYVCVYIYIYRERERESMSRVFTVEGVGFQETLSPKTRAMAVSSALSPLLALHVGSRQT